MTDDYISLEEKLSKKISKKIGEQLKLSNLDTAKVEYGLSILFVDVFKMLVMYTFAIMLHILPAVFITHLVFISLRTTGKGFHASNSALCTVLSVFFLVFLPYVTSHFNLWFSRPSFVFLVLCVCTCIVVNKWLTDKRNVVIEKIIKQTGTIILLITMIGLLQPSDEIRTFIGLGLAIATLLMFIKTKGEDKK
ncbi:hypothetical protein A5844_000108 [Enterococcus sp. 10A9_DIV0425]|uniref:AgrB-like protein n=1 Tax=Candidatus Enterococcus wittei TaxID=1987383 RepID=A0A2C9XR59_9ENTE|nr:accessory gene regulator B family protein [Enterococcus sp. 10A9_DIV0425]OTP11894.1 hypothetical protein A5844_000108 [Enterococcus sp. 10A9_DIV0425]THE06686.1 hypothetical protein E1H99_12820 [Enterococcus hirae]